MVEGRRVHEAGIGRARRIHEEVRDRAGRFGKIFSFHSGDDMQKRDSSAYVNDHGDKVFRMMSAYYTRYYRDSLGLSDWLERGGLRMGEGGGFRGRGLELCG